MSKQAKPSERWNRSAKARRRQLKKLAKTSKMTVHTGNVGHECDIEWTVDNVLKLVKVMFNSRLSWRRSCACMFDLIVRIDDHDNPCYSHVDIGFQRKDLLKEATRLCFDLSLQNENGDVYRNDKGSLTYPSGGKTKWLENLSLRTTVSQRCGDLDVVTRNNLRDDSDINVNLVQKKLLVWDENQLHGLYVLPSDTLVLKGVVHVYGCCVTSRLVSPPDKSKKSDSMIVMTTMMKDFQFAYEAGMFTDFQLEVGGELLPVHKFVLAARSPILRRCIQLREDRGNDTPLKLSLEKDVLKAFLKYLYVGIVGEVRWKHVMQLYKAGVEYEVYSLRDHCSMVLASNLCQSKVVEVFKLADEYDDQILKKAAVDYIRDNFFKMKEAEEWLTLIQESPELASEVLAEISASIH